MSTISVSVWTRWAVTRFPQTHATKAETHGDPRPCRRQFQAPPPHRKQVEEQGLRGAKALQELHRRWKALQAEGGEELQSLLAREAELREKPLL